MTPRLRLAEILGALSLATDLGMGQPMSQALRTCLLSIGLGRAIGLSSRDLADTYYTTLLRFIGCTSDAHEFVQIIGGHDDRLRAGLADIANGTPDEVIPHLSALIRHAGAQGDADALARDAVTRRDGIAAHSMTAHCEVADMLAARLGLAASVRRALRHGFERWDGHGFPSGQAGDDIPIATRIAVVARDAEILVRLRGFETARTLLLVRRGHAYDPKLVDAFLECGHCVLSSIEDCAAWDSVLDAEPGGSVWITGAALESAFSAFADFADVKMPFTLGHSRGVARLADAAGRAMGMADDETRRLRWAALLHDLGRTGIANAVWERPGPLAPEEWERVRLHPYYTERVLSWCSALRDIARLAASDHERLDGSGYHRSMRANAIDRPARVLAAADALHAMLQARPHRPALTLDAAARELRAEVATGRLDSSVVEAVLAAAGAASSPKPIRSAPDGLTEREVEVLRLVARGNSNREIAATLGITPKTAGHHIQHIYDKVGISTRAAAAVFAVEHGLL